MKLTPRARIIVGGEHRVSSVSHNSAGVYGKLFSHLFSEEQKESLKTEALGVTLGDGVILSADTTVVDGVGSPRVPCSPQARSRSVPARRSALYGGVPARWLKQRLSPRQIEIATQFDLAKVRGHCLPATAGILRDLEHGDLSIDAARGMVDYMDAVPRIVMAGTRGANNEIVLGGIEAFRVGERTITDPRTRGRSGRISIRLAARAGRSNGHPTSFMPSGSLRASSRQLASDYRVKTMLERFAPDASRTIHDHTRGTDASRPWIPDPPRPSPDARRAGGGGGSRTRCPLPVRRTPRGRAPARPAGLRGRLSPPARGDDGFREIGGVRLRIGGRVSAEYGVAR